MDLHNLVHNCGGLGKQYMVLIFTSLKSDAFALKLSIQHLVKPPFTEVMSWFSSTIPLC